MPTTIIEVGHVAYQIDHPIPIKIAEESVVEVIVVDAGPHLGTTVEIGAG